MFQIVIVNAKRKGVPKLWRYRIHANSIILFWYFLVPSIYPHNERETHCIRSNAFPNNVLLLDEKFVLEKFFNLMPLVCLSLHMLIYSNGERIWLRKGKTRINSCGENQRETKRNIYVFRQIRRIDWVDLYATT